MGMFENMVKRQDTNEQPAGGREAAATIDSHVHRKAVGGPVVVVVREVMN